MTSQIQGEILFKGIDAASSQYVFTPWQPARGAEAISAVEIMTIGSVTLTWNVETKSTDERDDQKTDVYADQTITDGGVDSVGPAVSSQFRELFRYRFSTGATADAAKWVVFRALEPSWKLNGQ